MTRSRDGAVRCISDELRVRVRVGRRGWRRTCTADAALASLVASLTPNDRERLARCTPVARAAVVAARTVLALGGADAAIAADRVLLHVHVIDGSAEADRDYWRTADPANGGLASPQRFAATLPSAVAGDVALVLGLRGPAFVTTSRGTFRTGSPRAPSGFRRLADVLLDVTVDTARRHARAVSVRLPSDARPAGSLGGVRRNADGVNGGAT